MSHTMQESQGISVQVLTIGLQVYKPFRGKDMLILGQEILIGKPMLGTLVLDLKVGKGNPYLGYLSLSEKVVYQFYLGSSLDRKSVV